jgi:MarR family transcriptional regulator, lower aerobic nicotinate degradation pathway regulator
MDSVYEMPGHLIRRAHQLSTAIFAEECAEFDLTPVQYAALEAIEANPDVDATRLSSLIAFDRSTIGDVLERLEAKGWILRAPSPTDRRIKLVRLRNDGARLLHEVEPAVRRVQERLLAPLAARDRATMLRLLTQLASLHNDVTSVPQRSTHDDD